MAAEEGACSNGADATHARTLREELWRVLKLALPTMGMYSLLIGCETVSLVFLGQAKGTSEEISAMGLGNSVYNCICLAIGFGFTSSIETTVTQARGANDEVLSKLYLHRCQLWMIVLAAVTGSVVCCTELILNALHSADPVTAAHAGTYTQLCALGLVGAFQTSAMRKYLIAHQDAFGGFLGQLLALPLHVLLCWLLAPKYRLKGLGIALAIKGWTDFIFIAVYASWIRPSPATAGWWRMWRALQVPSAARRMLDYLRLALANVVRECSEWWAFEILVFMAGYLHDPNELAGHVTLVNASNILYLACMGANKAASTLVGDATGRGSEPDAKRALNVTLGWNAFVMGACGVVTILLRHPIARVFSPHNADICAIVVLSLPAVVMTAVLDGARLCIEGALMGFAKQDVCGKISAFCWWVLLPPISLTLCFGLHLKVRGLWFSTMVISASSLLLTLRAYSRLSFAAVHTEAMERMARDGGAGTETSLPLASSEVAASS
mmetsp:Transcript_12482/g.29403  ORF Transcript_12482/g.29403 Transcript_12482/m.29403 type:complete len:496 (-) Transcript_12482:158-1645(-)|eukprot:CAMPEP_0178461326 /NCGR_PEP_ID=MMETSP0689_2-20121128/49247_1 /TAXON_ID=160604 /ORGANISM="Amphidinium massartii, Strain CS-259" /LENGTH=495 /DNA_ID=CAMNT_0020088149 /DNA_START=33 /DNA_END=1520 /DNA_ORIENTATION=+